MPHQYGEGYQNIWWGGVTIKWMQKGQVKLLGQLVGWVQVDGAGSSEGVRSAGGVGLLLSGCRRVR